MKIFWISVVIAATLGIVLMTTGFLGGANYNLYYDIAGIHRGEDIKELKEDNMDSFQNLEVDVYSADVEIISGNEFGIEINCDEAERIIYTNENGKLTIKQQEKMLWRIFNISFRKNYVRITLPQDAVMKNVFVKKLSGKMVLNDLKGERINLINTSGNISIDNCATDILDIDVISGNVKAAGIQSNGTNIKITSGRADLSGSFLNNTDVSLTSGSIKMQINGNEKDYNKNLSTVSGSIKVNGNHLSGIANIGAQNTITVHQISGSTNIDFSE